jgi:hypothetical protein
MLLVEIFPHVIFPADICGLGGVGSKIANVLELSPFGSGAGSRRLCTLAQIPGKAYAKCESRVHLLSGTLTGRALLLLGLELRLRLRPEKCSPGIFELA